MYGKLLIWRCCTLPQSDRDFGMEMADSGKGSGPGRPVYGKQVLSGTAELTLIQGSPHDLLKTAR